jgi:hypothetical protein
VYQVSRWILHYSLCILLVAYDPLIAVLVPGLLMSVADSSPRVMEVVGPRGLLHFLASMRFYSFRFVRMFPHSACTQSVVLCLGILWASKL